MSRTPGSPSHSRFSHFRCEEATITNVNRNTFTVTAETRHTAKTVEDIQCMVPYHHFSGGEGIHHLPEVGAICYIAFPNDNTPPFILGYIGAASVVGTTDDAPERSTVAAEGSPTDVSFRSRRPRLNPGDLAFSTRDENFIFLRRGGIVQIGATPISQRVYIPVLNFIKDFCENYEMHAFAGDVSWRVERVENDPSGNAPAVWLFHMNEFAQDAKASVRIQHFPISTGSGPKAAWAVHVAPQGIDRDDGSVVGEVYSMVLTTDGKKTEFIGADRTTTVNGDDTLTVHGDRTVQVDGDEKTTVNGDVEHVAGGQHVIGGAGVRVGSGLAASPGVLGDRLVQWLSTQQWPVVTVGGVLVASPTPIQLAALQTILSAKVTLE